MLKLPPEDFISFLATCDDGAPAVVLAGQSAVLLNLASGKFDLTVSLAETGEPLLNIHRDEIIALAKDAARYRFLRDNHVREVSNTGDLGIKYICNFDHWKDVDASIDDEIAIATARADS